MSKHKGAQKFKFIFLIETKETFPEQIFPALNSMAWWKSDPCKPPSFNY